MGSSLISFFYFDTSLRISISRLGSNQASGRFLNTFISLSDLIQCLVEQLYNEPAADAYSCYLSFLLYVYPSPLTLLYYSNIIFQAYCANCGPCPDIAFFRIFSSSKMVLGSWMINCMNLFFFQYELCFGVFRRNACLIKILSFSLNFYRNRFLVFFVAVVVDRY